MLSRVLTSRDEGSAFPRFETIPCYGDRLVVTAPMAAPLDVRLGPVRRDRSRAWICV